MTRLSFAPRLLWLAEDAAVVRGALAGRAYTPEQAGPLRNEVSTDEIIPLPAMVHFDAALAAHPHTGFTTPDGQRPIGRGAVQAAGIEVVVAGARYGKGSSREHAVVAEQAAGVRLVVAQSFERIWRQNADNLGLYTSTDFGLLPRIQRGEAIAVEDLLHGRDALAQRILRAGGLLALARQGLPAPQPWPDEGPLTLFEKIVRRHALAPLRPGEGGFVRADRRFIHEYYTGMCAWLLQRGFGDALVLHEPGSIVAFEDHLSYVQRSPAHVAQGLVGSVTALSRAHRAFVAAHGLKHHGFLPDEGSEGISHAMMAEQYARPGELLLGTDSHTPHSGALGCVAYGVGTTDMALAFVSGHARLTMPEVLRVQVAGRLPAGVAAKDLALHLLALPALRSGLGVGRVFEFGGPAVRAMATDERATLCNMVAEMGGFTGYVEPDEETQRFILERRGQAVALEPWMRSDERAHYAAHIEVDAAALSPMVARPGDPGHGLPLAALAEPVPVDIAYGGSCTAGKLADFEQYHAVLAWAAQQGLTVAPGVRLYLQFGTEAVREQCRARGWLATFEAVGAELLAPACGACANGGPGASEHAGQVTVSAVNRNFPGRSGPGSVWLASPATVAASAIAGRLRSFAALQAEHGVCSAQVGGAVALGEGGARGA